MFFRFLPVPFVAPWLAVRAAAADPGAPHSVPAGSRAIPKRSLSNPVDADRTQDPDEEHENIQRALQSNGGNDRVVAYTIASRATHGLQYVGRSVEENGELPLIVRGLGDAKFQSWDSSIRKMVLQKDMAERTPQDKLLLFVDAYDVLVVGDQKQIVERYEALRANAPKSCTIFFNTEAYCAPYVQAGKVIDNCIGGGGYGASLGGPVEKMAQYVPGSSPPAQRYPFLNSGVHIGPAKDLAALMQTYPVLDDPNDQMYWGRVWFEEQKNGKGRICVDYDGILAQSMGMTNLLEVGSDAEARQFLAEENNNINSKEQQQLLKTNPVDDNKNFFHLMFNPQAAKGEQFTRRPLLTGDITKRAHPVILHYAGDKTQFYPMYKRLFNVNAPLDQYDYVFTDTAPIWLSANSGLYELLKTEYRVSIATLFLWLCAELFVFTEAPHKKRDESNLCLEKLPHQLEKMQLAFTAICFVVYAFSGWAVFWRGALPVINLIPPMFPSHFASAGIIGSSSALFGQRLGRFEVFACKISALFCILVAPLCFLWRVGIQLRLRRLLQLKPLLVNSSSITTAISSTGSTPPTTSATMTTTTSHVNGGHNSQQQPPIGQQMVRPS